VLALIAHRLFPWGFTMEWLRKLVMRAWIAVALPVL
jgi:hypothetical protein